MRTLGALILLATLAGCGEPAGSEGKAVDVAALSKAHAAQAPKDDVRAPAPPSDGGPGGRP